MAESMNQDKNLVFGLDIGTRSIVGTVGYRMDDHFRVIAHCVKEHETRAMLDGQIHDIGRVGHTIEQVKDGLERQLEHPLSEVCIAAAGRVLKTMTVHVEYQFQEETIVEKEHIHNLELLGVEQAQKELIEKNDTKYRFYCVGYSVIKYYLNDEIFLNLEGHKAEQISAEMIATFLPEDVVDGLYSAVANANLTVANLTLEPIAAINVAIPEAFRMLNIALVDVGAGTSDICVTKDGSIIAYGMIPHAGDELTEVIVQHFLVDFKMAEHIKLASTTDEMIEYTDIMMIQHTIAASEVWELVAPVVDSLTTEIAVKIKELNGDRSVSATFVVGGGGKIHGFTELLADKLGIVRERVALRGEEVLQKVSFADTSIKKDPLLVTPIGICLNYYDQKNNFIFVRFNGERMKLYDNNKLTIVDAAMQAGFPNELLFPRRGTSVTYYMNGKQKVARGQIGESAVVRLNGKIVSLNTPIDSNSDITIEPSTVGEAALCHISDLEEFTQADISFVVNGKMITCPKFAEVNGSLEPSSYLIEEGDKIEIRNYYTVDQLRQFMDIAIDTEREILVNHRSESLSSLIYENFTIEWTVVDANAYGANVGEKDDIQEEKRNENSVNKESVADSLSDDLTRVPVYVNKQPVILHGKDHYMFADVFDFIDFDLSRANGRTIVTRVNGREAEYTQELWAGDQVEVFWQ